MSSLNQYSSDGVPNIVIRKAEQEDGVNFANLMTACGGVSLFRATFGQINFSALVEYSYLSIISNVNVYSMEKEENIDVSVGFLAISDSISATTTDHDSFDKAIEALQFIYPLQKSNTLFLHFWCFDDKTYKLEDVGPKMIRNVFAKCNDVDYIIWICPNKTRITDYIKNLFVEIDLTDHAWTGKGKNPLDKMKAFVLLRSKFLPKLQIREARVEDNDDLLPILQNSTPHVLIGQEDYFLPDLIQSQDERNRFFVGVNNNVISGMLATSLDVNVSLITKIYDLSPFSDIIIEKVERPRPYPLVITIVGDLRLLKKTEIKEMITNLDCLFIDAEQLLPASDISYAFDNPNDNSVVEKSIKILQDHIAKILESNNGTSKIPLGIVVLGFPRTDGEAVATIKGQIHFDIIVELQNVSDEVEVEDDDEFMHSHLDSVETLRNHFADDRTGNTKWIKQLVDGDSYKQLNKIIDNIVEGRLQEIDAAKSLDDNEPAQANSFAITVFCIDDAFNSRGDDMLRVAFEDHPNLDYCMYMVPNTAKPTPLTKSMVVANTKLGISFDQTLYIMHRDTLLAADYLKIVRYSDKLTVGLDKFLLNMDPNEKKKVKDNAEVGFKDFELELRDNPSDVSFVAMIENEIVGVISLTRKCCSPEDTQWLRANYQIDRFIDYDRHRTKSLAFVTDWVVNPVFSRWSRFMLREIMRDYQKTAIFYQTTGIPCSEILEEMVPVAPRLRVQAPIDGSQNDGTTYLERPTPGVSIECPLFFTSKSLLSAPKSNIRTRIVIVGGSTYCYSFLEALCFVPHLNFPNICVVLEHIPSALSRSDEFERAQRPQNYSGCMSVQDLSDPIDTMMAAFGLSDRIIVIRGRLTDIDRTNKAIVISDETIVEYDVLVVASCAQDNSTNKIHSLIGVHPLTCASKGVFGIGNPSADEAALEWSNTVSGNIVIYGTGIDALAAAGSLLNEGIDPSRISLIFKEDTIADIGHYMINDSIVMGLNDSGISIHLGCEINDVSFSRQGYVEGISFEKTESIEVELENESKMNDEDIEGKLPDKIVTEIDLTANTVILCIRKACDADVFAAINDSGLIFDGGIVVDENFCTIDPCIYALGVFTKFSRIYKDALPHSNLNSREVAVLVAKNVLNTYLDPSSPTFKDLEFIKNNVSQTNTLSKESIRKKNVRVKPEQLPVFIAPKHISAIFPGGLYFFRSVVTSINLETNALITGHPGSDKLTILKFDLLGKLEEILYIGRVKIEERNISRLVGYHESYMNSATYAYEKGLIKDWIDYFREDWASLLYHDKFLEFIIYQRESLTTDKCSVSTLEQVFQMAEIDTDDQNVSIARKELIGERSELLPIVTRKFLEAQTLEFLRHHKPLLTKFYIPSAKSSKEPPLGK